MPATTKLRFTIIGRYTPDPEAYSGYGDFGRKLTLTEMAEFDQEVIDNEVLHPSEVTEWAEDGELSIRVEVDGPDPAAEVARLRNALERIYQSGKGKHVEIAREALNA